MSDLERLLGRENLAILVKAAGGTRLWVPKYHGPPPGGGRNGTARLASLFGESLAVLLVFHFGDSLIYIPKGSAPAPVDRRKLKRLERRGLTAKEIARTLGCSERTVTKHRAKNRTDQHGRKEA